MDRREEEELDKLLEKSSGRKKQLKLYQRFIRDNEIPQICAFIGRFKTIKKVNLGNNLITHVGIKLLAESLLENDAHPNLEELSLNFNKVDNEGAIALANSLCSNTKLQRIKLSNCVIGDEGALAFANMMKRNSSLVGLEIDCNPYGKATMKKLAEALSKNHSIKSLLVGNSRSLQDRLAFARYMIQIDEKARTDAVFAFSKERDNETISCILEEWKRCKSKGKKLIRLPREFQKDLAKLNRMGDDELDQIYRKVRNFMETAREDGIGNLKRAKILMMGKAGSGKTSLTRSIIQNESLLSGNGPDRATVSVEINQWELEGVKCSIWDFGGQEEYSMTHSFFISPRCIVVICVNLSAYEETDAYYEENIQVYIDSVQMHAPGVKFLIVGTHIDEMKYDALIIERKCDHILKCCREVELAEIERLNNDIEALETRDASLSKQDLREIMGVSSKIQDSLKSVEHVVVDDDDDNPDFDEEEEAASAFGSRFGATTRNTSVTATEVSSNGRSVSEKMKEELLARLKDRRDSRPVLLNNMVYAVTSAEGLKGMLRLEDDLRDIIVQPEKYQISTEFPQSYVDLVDRIMEYVEESEKNRSTLLGFGRRNKPRDQKLRPMVRLDTLHKDFVEKKGKKGRKKPFKTINELENALELLHDTGYILWFKNIQFLRDQVFVSPQWVVDMIKSVLRHNMFADYGEGRLQDIPKPLTMSDKDYTVVIEEFKNKALLDFKLMEEFPCWRDATETEQFHLVALMQHFDLMFEIPADLDDRDSRRRFFIPLYLKESFGMRTVDESEREKVQLDLDDFLAEGLTPKEKEDNAPEPQLMTVEMSRQLLSADVKRSELRLEDVSAEKDETELKGPNHIQWRYEFAKSFPEGLFLRLLVRCHPFISYDFEKPPTEYFLKARTAGGVEVFLQEERKKYGIAGALVLTCIQTSKDTSLWEVFSLFAFAIEELLSSFSGLNPQVFITVNNPTIGRVILPRDSIERQQVRNWTKQNRSIYILVEGEKVPLLHLVPPLYVLPRDDQKIKTPKRFNMQPELVRYSKVATIDYSLRNVREQIEEESSRQKERIAVLGRKLMDVVDLLLRSIYDLKNIKRNRNGEMYHGVGELTMILKVLKIESSEINEIQAGIQQLKDFTEGAFYNRKRLVHINFSTLKGPVEAAEMLFDIYENQLVQNALPKKFGSVPDGMQRLLGGSRKGKRW